MSYARLNSPVEATCRYSILSNYRRICIRDWYSLTLCLLVPSDGNLCKQVGPRWGPTKCLAWAGSKLFDIWYSWKNFLKKSADDRKAWKFPDVHITCWQEGIFCIMQTWLSWQILSQICDNHTEQTVCSPCIYTPCSHVNITSHALVHLYILE